MGTKESQPKIFRPWDNDTQKGGQKVETNSKQELRIPPTEWSEAFDKYWGIVTMAEGFPPHMSKSKQRPKRFKCPYCDVAFSNNGQLKGHVRIHTGERPFKCEEPGCEKSFTRNEELTRHRRIHTGVRPYPCAHCGKTFGRKDHLKKHTKTHFPQYTEIPSHFFVYPYIYGY
ncbi:zinc finger protein 629-like [Cimex lectularius]|uniref:C2H2-type domain-containing protein n=1 Tax=Cimex lectularius TaxID=79782 RepID=A0A8I6RMM2_CIMLE|nr:zinc finger protein 629-like [Cimex lectularius]